MTTLDGMSSHVEGAAGELCAPAEREGMVSNKRAPQARAQHVTLSETPNLQKSGTMRAHNLTTAHLLIKLFHRLNLRVQHALGVRNTKLQGGEPVPSKGMRKSRDTLRKSREKHVPDEHVGSY